MPPLVIVCGPPASGKTALAAALSARFGLPVISKDSFKEAIMDHLGGGEAVGAAAFAVQFAAARTMLRSGVGLILEGAFFAGHEGLANVAAMGDCVVLQLSCPIEVIEARFTRRLGSRHPRHRGTEALPELRERVEKGTYIPTLDKPALKIETSNGLQPNEEEIVRWVRGTLSARRTPLHPSGDQPSLREAWDEHAGEWIRWAREPDHDTYWRFARAAFFELLPAPGRRTLDLGCGEGRVSRDLAELGHRVVGIDASRTLVTAAVEAAPAIPALVADAAALPISSGSCDVVVAYMSLQDVDDMPRAIGEIARVLEPGGHLCMAIVHPINSAGYFASDEPEATFEIKGSYFDATRYDDRIERRGLTMTFSGVHRPLVSYSAALEAAGFAIESLREVRVDEVSAAEASHHRRWLRVPMFLDLRAVKVR